MSDPNYLYRVLGLSFLPRAVTFLLTLISFPLMVRGLGAGEYGIIVYLTSVATILEIPAGFGVSGAVGKAIAERRTSAPDKVRDEIARWARWQLKVCFYSLPVSAIVGYLAVTMWVNEVIPIGLLAVVLLSLYISVFIAFARAVLTSMLRFKQLALLDAFESLTRSAGWCIVGLVLQSVWMLAWAQLATALCTLGLAIYFLISARSVSEPAAVQGNPLDEMAAAANAPGGMFRQSMAFLLLLLGTRAYQALPVMLVSKLLGFEVAGILGAFARIAELVNVPFIIVGNALMVRVPEIHKRGHHIIARYWDMLSRLAVVALGVAIGFWLMSETIAAWMLPGSALAVSLFAIQSVQIFFRAVSDLAAPAADYVGGLKRRIYFLTSFAVLQIPVIWLGWYWGGALGAVTAMVGSYSTMVLGYIAIAKSVFFSGARYRPPAIVVTGSFLIVVIATVTVLSVSAWHWRVAMFGGLALAVFMAWPPLRRTFWPSRLIRFDFL
ncbi:MAG: oligosaccharide flippase family protein [Pseudomonadota bacterium]